MDESFNEQFEPVCRFGPGGDYISVWPSQHSKSPRSAPNRLAGLLERLSEIITTKLLPNFDAAADAPTNTHCSTAPALREKGNLEYEVESTESDKPANPAPVAVIEDNRQFQGQTMLFPDDSRAGRPTVHKPKYRIRTYHRTAKKKPALQLPGQGSLFEADFKSAKTA